MDIEGAGTGSAGRGQRACHHGINLVLAICMYHRSEDLLGYILDLIRSIAPEYHVFLRRYAEECWEGVCYAIPKRRL